MKNLYILTAALFLTACGTTSYIGDKFATTANIDVYYAAKDVKKDYKVIGHIYSSTVVNAEKVKASIIEKAKAVGADGVIILGLTPDNGSKDAASLQQADAIKYNQ